MELKPCPAGKCDAQLFGIGDFVFCPKCKEKNPNYSRVTESRQVTFSRKEPEIDLETGIVKWS